MIQSFNTKPCNLVFLEILKQKSLCIHHLVTHTIVFGWVKVQANCDMTRRVENSFLHSLASLHGLEVFNYHYSFFKFQPQSSLATSWNLLQYSCIFPTWIVGAKAYEIKTYIRLKRSSKLNEWPGVFLLPWLDFLVSIAVDHVKFLVLEIHNGISPREEDGSRTHF